MAKITKNNYFFFIYLFIYICVCAEFRLCLKKGIFLEANFFLNQTNKNCSSVCIFFYADYVYQFQFPANNSLNKAPKHQKLIRILASLEEA